MIKVVSDNLSTIKTLLKKYGVTKAYLFGSATGDSDAKANDVDFIINFPKDMDYVTYADNYFALMHELQDLLKKDVDLVAEKTLQNPYLIQSINQNKIPLI